MKPASFASVGVLTAALVVTTEGQATRQAVVPQVSLSYLGAAGWQITDGQAVILIDPYLSRVRRAVSPDLGSAAADLPGDIRPIVGPNDPLVSDEATIDAHITRADLIVVTHSCPFGKRA